MPNPAPTISIEDEVLGNIRRQVLGETSHTVADLDLSLPFLRRVADRALRESFEKQFRIVVGKDLAGSPPDEGDILPGGPVRVVAPRPAHEAAAYRASVPESASAVRGYRAPILDRAGDPWPVRIPTGDEDPALAGAADLVGKRLARDGLLHTVALAIEALGVDRYSAPGALVDALRRAGVPTDLLPFFQSASDPIAHIVAALRAGASASGLRKDLGKFPFRFRPACAGFRVLTESGEHPIRSLRLHAARPDFWPGIGAEGGGSSLDVVRQIAQLLPDAPLIIAAGDRHAGPLARLVGQWPNPGRVTIAAGPAAVSQWAQDSGKSGEVEGKRHTLLPRYASRGEEMSTLIPGDTFIAEALGAAGLALSQSPLLFQGGNLVAASGRTRKGHEERLLLIGEAEIARNIALGLTSGQVLDAFRIEFGVDRCVVLPAVSFHVDFEFTIRVHEERPLAFVNDSSEAARLILACALPALASAGVLSERDRDRALALIAAPSGAAGPTPRSIGDALDLIWPPLAAASVGPGAWPDSLAGFFSSGPTDSGVGNFQQFLFALDILSAMLLPARRPRDRYLLAYVNSLARRESDRRALHRQLALLGVRIVPVPSLSEANLSINYLNGIHDAAPSARYLMPSHGGLYAPLDLAAAAVFQRELPGVEVVPVRCAESQRRCGAAHCAAALC